MNAILNKTVFIDKRTEGHNAAKGANDYLEKGDESMLSALSFETLARSGYRISSGAIVPTQWRQTINRKK